MQLVPSLSIWCLASYFGITDLKNMVNVHFVFWEQVNWGILQLYSLKVFCQVTKFEVTFASKICPCEKNNQHTIFKLLSKHWFNKLVLVMFLYSAWLYFDENVPYFLRLFSLFQVHHLVLKVKMCYMCI